MRSSIEQDWRLLNVFFFYNKLFYSLTLGIHILESKLSESFCLFSKFLCCWLTVMYYLRFKVYLRCQAKSVFNAIINIGVKVNFSVICFRWLLMDHLTLSTVDKYSWANVQFLKLLPAQLSERPWYQSSLLCHSVKHRAVKGSEKFCCSNK